ncbi:MAG: Holliday junction resolvase RuvX [Vicinamibacteria bacterium]|nr:Holliday junction resolvase RuvX [Vicinamibacteria bacterium]
MRVLGIDYGARRVGLAVSDATGLLARPLKTLDRSSLASDAALVDAVLVAVAEVSTDDEPLAAIVVGLPRRLDGSPNDQTPRVEAFVTRLAARTPLPVVLQDERLSSHEAESRLALTEKDWRRRKQMLDAASAAVILQDYLDAKRPTLLADPDLR